MSEYIDELRDKATGFCRSLARDGVAEFRAAALGILNDIFCRRALAALGYLSPLLAGGAMALSSVSVVGNALLLRRRWK